MKAKLDYAALKKKQRELRDDKFPDVMGLRVHRAISWIGCAERCEKDAEDERFIFLWIAFNAAYADAQILQAQAATDSHKERMAFFRRLVLDDKDNRIHNAIWEKFSGPVRLLMKNRYVFSPFWQHHNGAPGYADWEDRFRNEDKNFKRALAGQKTERVLEFVFGRLNVLRNQLIHGGATWRGKVNRRQVGDGCAILGFLMPVFIDIMMDNPEKNWGKPFYPVVPE